jgi:hypothetical protein
LWGYVFNFVIRTDYILEVKSREEIIEIVIPFSDCHIEIHARYTNGPSGGENQIDVTFLELEALSLW